MTSLPVPDELALGAEARERLARIAASLPLLADLSRADLLLYSGDGTGPATVIAQARPHSVSAILTESLVGQTVTEVADQLLFRVLRRGRPVHETHEVTDHAIPCYQEVHPIRSSGRIIGALRIETNLLEHERLRRRSPVFQEALAHLQQMALHGHLCLEEHLSPFGEHDGIIIVDAAGMIRYVSGIATNLYRKVGRGEKLVDTPVASLATEAGLWAEALDTGRCLERETDEQGLIWVRKAIPIRAASRGRGWLRGRLATSTAGYWGVLLTIHDATEARRKERDLRIRTAMIQEIHHRVKNNLQTIAALLRLQARRSKSEEVRQILQITINRILSIAVVHEFLTQSEGLPINMKDIAQQVIHQLRRGIVDPERSIQLNLVSDDVYLPAQQATACALVINELIQNALEHGFADRDSGTIVVRLCAQQTNVLVEVRDDGIGLPAGFDIHQDGSLGLRIVQTLVQEELKGTLELQHDHGVRAIVLFPQPAPAPSVSPISGL